MDNTQAVQPRALPVVALLAGGLLALCAGAVAGGDAVAAGAAAFFIATLVALGQTARPVLTWTNALVVFIAVMWLVPIKLYSLPVNLPFELELYRVLIIVLVLAFVVGSITTKRQVEAYGASKPLFVLAAAALATQIINADAINAAGGQQQAVKSLSLFLSFIVVFLLFASTLGKMREIETVVMALVLGGVVVAVAALYEARTNYNVFDHLSNWVPGFERNEREVLELRGGRLRVHASAQHPIAFGAALTMLIPFALYLAAKARTREIAAFWVVCLTLIIGGAAATISRTTVAMGIAMGVTTFLVRRQVLVRLLPLFLVLPLFVHAAAPGVIGGLVKSFGFGGGPSLIEGLSARGGESGSGRFADVDPALDLWLRSPIVGLGLDNPEIATSGAELVTPAPGQQAIVPLIFDNQYLHTLVALGLVGIVALIWLVWGSVVRFVRTARARAGPDGDFVAACGVACAGYGASMFFFDSLAFIQVTLLLFITVAVGLKAIALTEEPAPATEPAAEPR